MYKTNIWRITIDTNPEDCNLNCIMCEEHSKYSEFIPKLYKKTGIKRRIMPFEYLEKIFIQAKELNVKEIIPSTMGEPLLYKYFDEIIRLCYKYQIQLNLTTNGTFPKKTVRDWANQILPIVSDIKISWNGATKEVAESIMEGINFEKVLLNVKELISIREEVFLQTNHYAQISFQVTFMQNNMHELSDIIKLASELGVDRVKGHHLWDHFDEIKNLSFKKNIESRKIWNQYVKEAYLTQNQYLKKEGTEVKLENIHLFPDEDEFSLPSNSICPFLNKEIWISATGKISPCCAPDELRDSLGDFGNIQKNTIQEVVKSTVYQNLVHQYTEHSLCKNCNMRKVI